MNEQQIFQNESSSISIEFLYSIGGYNTYNVSVSNNCFAGACTFCIQENICQEYIQQIDYMIQTLNGEIEISDCESDAYLKILFVDQMNCYMLGQIGGSYADNMLKFKFKVDQTILHGIKRVLKGHGDIIRPSGGQQ